MKFISIYADGGNGFVNGGPVEAEVKGQSVVLPAGDDDAWEFHFSNGLYVNETNDVILVPIP